MGGDLYSDIVQALADAKRLGRMEERYARSGKGDLVSERKATEIFGAALVRRYRDLYGCPERTGAKANSKRLYSLTRLNELVEAERIEEAVIRFEVKVRDSQRRTDRDVAQAITGRPILLETFKPRDNQPNH